MLKNKQIAAVILTILCCMIGLHTNQSRAENTGNKNDVISKLTNLRKRSNKIQKQLDKIAKKAEEQSPKLKKLRQRLETTYNNKLKEHGYPNEKEMGELRNLQRKLQNDRNLGSDERKALMEKFQKSVRKLQIAQQKAQKDPEVAKTYREWNQVKSEEMIKIDEGATSLQQEQQDVMAKIRNLQKQVQVQVQGRKSQ